MDNSLKGLILAAGVIITCLVVGLGFYLSREAKNTSNNGANQISSMNTDYQDIDVILYDGLKISGAEVVNAIDKHKSDAIYMCVKTKNCISLLGVFYNRSYTDEVMELAGPYKVDTVSKDNYISATEQFLCTVYKDDSDVIVGIRFVQQ